MIASDTAPRRSLWIPWVFVGGMLLVVAVNAVLIVASIWTFPGLTVGRAYERGRGYEAVLAEAARQDALGWRAEIHPDGSSLAVTVRDAAGRPVEGELSGHLVRPLDGEVIVLAPTRLSAGRWRAKPVAAPRRGQWDARLMLTGPGGAVFEMRRRVILP